MNEGDGHSGLVYVMLIVGIVGVLGFVLVAAGRVMTSPHHIRLGILAAALLFLSMFAGLFGGALSQVARAGKRQAPTASGGATGWGDRCPTAGQSNNATIAASHRRAAWRRCGRAVRSRAGAARPEE